MSAGRRDTPSPSHDGIGLEGQPRPPLAVLPQSEAKLSWRRSGLAMPESHTATLNDYHGGSTSGLHHVNVVDESSRCSNLYRPSYTMSEATTCTMDLPPPQVMSGGGQQDDAVTDGRGENGEQTIQVRRSLGSNSSEIYLFTLRYGNRNLTLNYVYCRFLKLGKHLSQRKTPMTCTTHMLAKLDLVLERTRQSVDMMVLYIKKELFAVTKAIEKPSRRRTLQGRIAMPVLSSVLAERGFGRCKR